MMERLPEHMVSWGFIKCLSMLYQHIEKESTRIMQLAQPMGLDPLLNNTSVLVERPTSMMEAIL